MARQAEEAQAIAPVRFIDQKFKSRTLVLAGGRCAHVVKSQITAEDAELIAYLEKHPDFVREE